MTIPAGTEGLPALALGRLGHVQEDLGCIRHIAEEGTLVGEDSRHRHSYVLQQRISFAIL